MRKFWEPFVYVILHGFQNGVFLTIPFVQLPPNGMPFERRSLAGTNVVNINKKKKNKFDVFFKNLAMEKCDNAT